MLQFPCIQCSTVKCHLIGNYECNRNKEPRSALRWLMSYANSSIVVLFVAKISLMATVHAEEDFDKCLCCCTQTVFLPQAL